LLLIVDWCLLFECFVNQMTLKLLNVTQVVCLLCVFVVGAVVAVAFLKVLLKGDTEAP